MAEYSRYPSASFPKNISYFLSKLEGYQKQKVRLLASSNASVGAGGYLEFTLPRGIVNLGSLQVGFYGSTTGNAGFPCGIETLIEGISVSAPSGLLDAVSNYGEAFAVVADTSFNAAAKTRRGVLQNGADQTTAVKTGTFAWKNFLGVLGSVQPSYFPTFATSDIRIRITLGSNERLTVAAGTYLLSNFEVSVDVISLQDGLYAEALTSHLAAGKTLDLPFKSFAVFKSYNGASADVNHKVSFSTNSLDQLWGWLSDPSEQLGGVAAKNGQSAFFHRAYGANVATWQTSVNGSYFPSAPLKTEYAYGLLEDTLGIAGCTQNGINPNISSLATWVDNAVFAWSFCHDDPSDSRLVSGLNLEGVNGSITLETKAGTALDAGKNVTSNIMLRFTSILSIGAGGSVYIRR